MVRPWRDRAPRRWRCYLARWPYSRSCHTVETTPPPSLSFRVTARLAPRKERKGPMGAGFEASEQQGEAYILTGEKTVQLQRAENEILLRTQMSHGALGTGSASQVRLSGL